MGYSRPHDERRFPTAIDQQRELTELRAALPRLDDVPRHVCGQLLVTLDNAWRRCFSRIGRQPRWKSKGRESLSFSEPDHRKWHLDEHALRFPKLGTVRAVVHRPLEGKPKTCTIKCDAGQWFASIVCEIDVPNPARREGPIVAIDRGIVNVIGDSNGNLVPSPRFYEKALARLARAQRVVARRQKGSKNREKASAHVAILHRKVRRQREHFLHVLSHQYAKSHGVVVIEHLNVSDMMKNHCLSRSIADAGWSCLAKMLDYKLARNGGRLEEETAYQSSQTCNACGCIDATSRVSQSLFRCTACGHTEHADLNAPKVLLQRYEARANRSDKPAEGIALQGDPMKQETSCSTCSTSFTPSPQPPGCG